MPHREIQHAVSEIHKELNLSQKISPESALLLKQAIQEIESALKEKGPSSQLERPLVSPLESWLVDFGEEHPKISGWARAIINQATALGL